MVSRIFVHTSPVSPDPEVLLFFPSCLSLLYSGEDMGPALWTVWLFLGPLRGAAELAEARRLTQVALCYGGRAARTHAPVNGLSKDNFCFSFVTVGVAPYNQQQNAPFPEYSGAGDLCGNRNQFWGRVAQLGLVGWRVKGPEENPVPWHFQSSLLRRLPTTPTSRTFYSRSPRKLSALSRLSKHHYPRSINKEILRCK